MRPAFSPLAVSLAFLLCAGAARAQGALLVVDAAGGPGSAFTSIAAAVSAAADGDVVLVRSGTYAPFTVEDRTLVVIAAPGAAVTVDGALGGSAPAVTVRTIAPDQAVVLEGLTIKGKPMSFTTSGSHGLRIESCDGQVWVQDCVVSGGSAEVTPRHGISVTDSEQVLLVHCTAAGKSFYSDLFESFGAGLSAVGSRVFAWDSQFTGGIGGPGARVEGGEFIAEDAVLQGGEGDGFFFGFCDIAVDGGAGLALTGSGKATLVNTHVTGGAADPVYPECSDPGPAVHNFFGSLTQLPGPTADFTVASPVPDGVDSQLTFAGQPGDVPVILMALTLGPVTYFPKYTGVLTSGNAVLFFLSPLPPSGSLVVPFGFGDALLQGTGSTIFLQGAVLKAGGGALLADAATLTTFDD